MSDAPSRAGSDPPVLDVAVLHQLADALGADAVRDVYAQFEHDAGAHVRRLRDACRREAVAEVEQPAHGLKGLSRTLGALALGQAAEAVERAARAGRCPDDAVIDRLDAAYAAVVGRLKAELARL